MASSFLSLIYFLNCLILPPSYITNLLFHHCCCPSLMKLSSLFFLDSSALCWAGSTWMVHCLTCSSSDPPHQADFHINAILTQLGLWYLDFCLALCGHFNLLELGPSHRATLMYGYLLAPLRPIPYSWPLRLLISLVVLPIKKWFVFLVFICSVFFLIYSGYKSFVKYMYYKDFLLVLLAAFAFLLRCLWLEVFNFVKVHFIKLKKYIVIVFRYLLGGLYFWLLHLDLWFIFNFCV